MPGGRGRKMSERERKLREMAMEKWRARDFRRKEYTKRNP